jgi:hypothetical protein
MGCVERVDQVASAGVVGEKLGKSSMSICSECGEKGFILIGEVEDGLRAAGFIVISCGTL